MTGPRASASHSSRSTIHLAYSGNPPLPWPLALPVLASVRPPASMRLSDEAPAPCLEQSSFLLAGPDERKERTVILVMWKARRGGWKSQGLHAQASTHPIEAVPTRADAYAALILCQVHFTRPTGQGVPLSIGQKRKPRHGQVTCSRSRGLEMAGFELR